MTVATLNTWEELVGNGNSNFNFTFHILDVADLKVYVNSVLQQAGYTTVKNADQSANPGGTVTFADNNTPAIGAIIRLVRRTPATQALSYDVAAAFPAASHEAALDRLTLIAQERAESGPWFITEVVTTLPPAVVANRGRLVLLEGTDEDDIFYLCVKLADDSYAWQTLDLVTARPAIGHFPTGSNDVLSGTANSGEVIRIFKSADGVTYAEWQPPAAIVAGNTGAWTTGELGWAQGLTYVYVVAYHPALPAVLRYSPVQSGTLTP